MCLAAKPDLASLKSEVDKVEIDKLKNVLPDLSNVVDNDVIKKLL